ncbi:MAG TPA: hypothetical protein VGU25_14900 [Acidobacteriaceae bacterium]|nr:hypothetical protein [Acidobacteriaceae bacterium]
MADEAREQLTANPPPRRRRHWWQRAWFKVLVILVVIGLGVLIASMEYAIHHAEPIIRARVIDTLSAHFHAPVELDHLDISLIKGVELSATGVEVEGRGLRIPYIADPDQPHTDRNAPMISVERFAFTTRIRGLMHQPTSIAEVDVDGMELHVPPTGQRSNIFGRRDTKHPPKISLLVKEIRCKNVKLFIDTTKPGKDPLEFDIQSMNLQDVGAAQPFTYQAELTNPVPVGEVHAEGHFGPWNVDDPRDTAIDGSYSFSHADLNTIKGIGGILSSHGQFSGVLDHIAIDGETSTPDFSLDVSDHPMPLHTVFHAYVDGTTGDTFLDPVQARLADSEFTARGKVVTVKGKGHDIDMNVNIPHGRMQDFLELGVKTRPPLMNGILSMNGHLHIPPGQTRVPEKMQLAGSFQLHNVRFNNPAVQDKVDGLSARAQGKPKDVALYSSDRQAEVSSMMSASFSLNHGLVDVHDLHYQIPGALVLLNGVYSTDGNLFEFKGHVRTDATASQMVTGWKSVLLKPVDRFLKKDGAGVQLPISISGTEGDVHFGLALHGTAEESDQAMAQDLKNNRQQMREEEKARREMEKAKKSQARADAGIVGDDQATIAERKAEITRDKSQKYNNNPAPEKSSAKPDPATPAANPQADPQPRHRAALPPQ